MSAYIKRISKIFGKSNKMLESRTVLYCVFLIALFNVYILLLHSNFNGLSVFFLTGIIVSAFHKNMIVILLSAIVVTNIVKHTAKTFYEGFDDEIEDKNKNKDLENDQYDSSKMSLSEDITKTIENLENNVDGKKTGNSKDLTEIKEQYSELISIQKGLLDGIKKVAEPLENAERIIEKLSNKMDGFRNR